MALFDFKFKPYIAIIGDIKNSRSIKNRQEFQNKLNIILDKVNEIYSSSIASNFIITLGDEFQGLLKSGKSLMDIIQYIKKEAYPVGVRFGIGVGAITTDINKEMSIGADGPAYYKARECIEYLRSLEKKKSRVNCDTQIKIDGENRMIELSINSILRLMYCIEREWTIKQREVVNYVLFEKKNQSETAKHFGVSQSNIQQVLSNADYYSYKDAYESLGIFLSEIKRNKR